jgi:general secretion pathway protein J
VSGVRPPERPRYGAARGFTLVEVLVAVAAMALLAVMAWSGIDAMHRAETGTRARSEAVLALQTGLSQWRADLDAMTQVAPVGGIDFDGRVVRITRMVQPADTPDSAIMVVAWGARQIDGQRHWLRWQSVPVRTREQLQLAWQQAALWGQNPSDTLRRQEVRIAPVDEWQVFYYRNNSWSSPLSSAAGAPATGTVAQTPLPDGVRLLLDMAQGQVLSGRLQHDWVRPTLGAARS